MQMAITIIGSIILIRIINLQQPFIQILIFQKKENCWNNRRNFDAERLLLFDEGLAFDTMISAELFPHFSNSFFVEIQKKEENNA